MIHTVTFDIATDASGDYDSNDTATYGYTVTGQVETLGPMFLVGVEWVDGDLVDGVDAVLSAISTPSGVDRTLLTLTNANDDAWYQPQVLVQDNAGTSTTFYMPPIVTGQLKVVVSSGGATKTGKLIAHLMEG